MKRFLAWLGNFDRRWIFLAMGLAVVIPLLYPLGLPATPSSMVKALYHAIDDVPDGSTVLVSVDLDPASRPEIEPFFHASVKHLKSKRCKLVFLTLWYQAPPLIEHWLKDDLEAVTFPGDRAYVRGEDYAWLGFREGKAVVIANLGQDMVNVFNGRDAAGTPFESIPVMKGHTRLSDFPLIVLVSAGAPGAKEYVQLVQARYSLPIVTASTAVSLTDLTPYYQAGQLLGLAGGMVDTAEYEVMVAQHLGLDPTSGMGAKALDVLNVGHLVIIFAIVLGNVVSFVGRKR